MLALVLVGSACAAGPSARPGAVRPDRRPGRVRRRRDRGARSSTALLPPTSSERLRSAPRRPRAGRRGGRRAVGRRGRRGRAASAARSPCCGAATPRCSAPWPGGGSTSPSCGRAFTRSAPPPLAVIVMAYFTGMLANLLPLPGGVGGVEGGMIGALLAFDVAGGLAVVAVLTYRAFAFWLPTIPGADRLPAAAPRRSRSGRALLPAQPHELEPGDRDRGARDGGGDDLERWARPARRSRARTGARARPRRRPAARRTARRPAAPAGPPVPSSASTR